MPNPLQLSRRRLLASIAAAAGASSVKALAAERGDERGPGVQTGRRDVIVVGAGVFGAWTAWHLLKLGRKVLLLDAWGPAHARASSGGESRMTRTVYGRDEIYTRFSWESLDEWRWLSSRSGLPIFHPTGVVFFFARREPYVTQSIEVHQRAGIPLEVLDHAALAKRFPQMVWDGVELGLFEPDRGVLMARRAVQTLVQQFVAAGGEYRQASILPPKPDAAFDSIRTSAGESLQRIALRVRMRAVAAEGFSGNTRLPDFPDAAGSVLLRVRSRRHALPARRICRAGPISTTATSTTACRTWKHAASRSLTTSTARRSIRIPAIERRAPRRSRMSAST